jgi:hypothetical protein
LDEVRVVALMEFPQKAFKSARRTTHILFRSFPRQREIPPKSTEITMNPSGRRFRGASRSE